MRCGDYQEMLNAYIDGEMLPDEERSVRLHIAECAECAREHASLVDTSRLLQEGLVHYPAPDVLKARIRSAIARESERPSSGASVATSGPRWGRLAAAGIAIALASSLGTYATVQRAGAARSVADAVLESHIRSVMPGHLTDVVSTNQHNVKPWFNGRVNLSPAVPSLDSAGFPLVGGRLDYVEGHAAAAVVYSRRQHLINVYSWPESGADLAPARASAQGYHLLHWRSGNVAFWAASDLNEAELGQFVGLFQRASGEVAGR